MMSPQKLQTLLDRDLRMSRLTLSQHNPAQEHLTFGNRREVPKLSGEDNALSEKVSRPLIITLKQCNNAKIIQDRSSQRHRTQFLREVKALLSQSSSLCHIPAR